MGKYFWAAVTLSVFAALSLWAAIWVTGKNGNLSHLSLGGERTAETTPIEPETYSTLFWLSPADNSETADDFEAWLENHASKVY